MNVVEFGQAAPNDRVSRRRIRDAVEITAESGDFYDVIGDGCLSVGFPWLGFDQFIQQVSFRCVQGDSWRQIRLGSVQHGHPEDHRPDDANDGDQVHQSFRAPQFGFLGPTSRFEYLMEHLDFPPHRVPVELLDGSLERFHRQAGDQLPRDSLAPVRCSSFHGVDDS